MEPEDLISSAIDKGLDGVAITNHDEVSDIEKARESVPPGVEFTVIPGAEVSTSSGHLLALGVEQAPKAGLSPEETIERVKELGGTPVLAHPFDKLRQTFGRGVLEEVEAIETINSRCLLERFNERAQRAAAVNSLTQVAGSDAHFQEEVGRAYTVVRGGTREIEKTAVSVVGEGRYLSGHIATKIYELRSRIPVEI